MLLKSYFFLFNVKPYAKLLSIYLLVDTKLKLIECVSFCNVEFINMFYNLKATK